MRQVTPSKPYSWVITGTSFAPPAARPKLEVRQAGPGSKVLDLFGAADLDLGDPEFDTAFRIRTEDERCTAIVLNQATRKWLLADGRAQDLPFRFERNELVTWQRDRLRPRSVFPALDYLCDVLDRTLPAVER